LVSFKDFLHIKTLNTMYAIQAPLPNQQCNFFLERLKNCIIPQIFMYLHFTNSTVKLVLSIHLRSMLITFIVRRERNSIFKRKKVI